MNKTDIEWVRNEDGSKGHVWNPVTGCAKVSDGCKNCYAEGVSNRFWGERKFTDVQCHDDRLSAPLNRKKPTRIFVNSMSDLFHEDVPVPFIDQVFAVMAIAKQHTFIILTKRPENMAAYLNLSRTWMAVNAELWKRCHPVIKGGSPLKLPNVYLGVSVEDQKTADQRIPLLLKTPAAIRFVSYEPALGPVDFRRHLVEDFTGDLLNGPAQHWPGLDWVIVGGESGPKARPMHPGWARNVRDQCQAANVPFFFKQWGEWVRMQDEHLFPRGHKHEGKPRFTSRGVWFDENRYESTDPNFNYVPVVKLGKKKAGHLLDGVEHKNFPTTPSLREAEGDAAIQVLNTANGGTPA